MNEQEKQKLLEGLESVEQKFNTYVETRLKFEKFNRSFTRFKYWMVAAFVLIVCQLGVSIYDARLPDYQHLAWPWLACWVLAFIGQTVPQREMKAIVCVQRAAEHQQHEDYYKALTGTD